MKSINRINYIISAFMLMGLSGAGHSQSATIKAIHYATGKPVIVEISGDKIAKLKPGTKDGANKLYVAPGLIDIQINGYLGIDYSDQQLTPEAFRKSIEALWKTGVTTVLPTVITASKNNLLKSFTLLNAACKDEEIAKSIPGFHLEGPYISPEKGYRGAHLEKYIRKPDWEEFTALQKTSGNRIKLVTLAPEQEGALPFIKNLKEEGIVVSLGHHNSTADQILKAVDAGASLSTHLGNGCANTIDRHNNPFWPQLAEDRLSASIITDGSHLNKQEVQTFYKVKGNQRTILISDALDLAGLPPGEYIRGERKVLLTPEVAKFPEENVLAGAVCSVTECIPKMVEFAGCSLADAINMASVNPARLMNLNDRGELMPGKRADLILFTVENGKIVIQKTIVAGIVVYEKK